MAAAPEAPGSARYHGRAASKGSMSARKESAKLFAIIDYLLWPFIKLFFFCLNVFACLCFSWWSPIAQESEKELLRYREEQERRRRKESDARTLRPRDSEHRRQTPVPPEVIVHWQLKVERVKDCKSREVADIDCRIRL